MACTCSSQPCTCEFTTVEQVLGDTLLDSLVPAIDCVRDLYTQLGLRSYQISLVWTRWSGGERGRGQQYVAQVEPLLPTPEIGDLGDIALELKEIGLNEQGTLSVKGISLRYSEDLLMGRGGPLPAGHEIPADVDFFWEVFLPTGPGTGLRRRFFPATAPNRDAAGLQWTLDLKETEGPRERDGRLQ